MQRPLFLHNEEDGACYDIQYEYMLGRDVLAAPVYLAEQIQWEVYLPKGEWIHLWTGDEYGKGRHTVPAALGDTPVFYRKDSEYAPLFEEIRRKHGK